jgi:Leucine-rich repeat (LRR) protein
LVYGKHILGKLNSDVTGVIFKSSSLFKIPGEIFTTFENLKKVNAESSGLVEIKSLENCNNLEDLIVSNNKIEILNEESFSKCPILKRIVLTANKVKQLPANIFQSNLKIEFIDLSFNLINGIAPCEFFKGLDNLMLVDLSGNKCIDEEVKIKNEIIASIKKKLSLCHSSWILLQVTDSGMNQIIKKMEL